VSVSEPSAPVAPRLIVGLGNPGREYEDTRHNIGFMIVDALAVQLQAPWTQERRWDCLLAKFTGGWLLKPLTYMNESGSAVSAVCRFFKIEPREVLAVYDDVDLPLGALRFRMNGSAGGHNGVRSLLAHLGGPDWPRLKVGIAAHAAGRPAGDRMVGHVLGSFTAAERPQVESAVKRAVQALRCALKDGLATAMNIYNRKEPTESQPSQTS
jgi:peptidyl-tRNA hydrolase, PTH1 family